MRRDIIGHSAGSGSSEARGSLANSMDPDLGSSFFRVEFYQSDPDQKASDVSKPCHSPPKADAEHLKKKPKTQDEECGNGNDPDENEEKDQG